MLKPTESHIKFFLKMKVVANLRSLLLFFLRTEANQDNWEKRMLVVNLEGMGDLVMFTSILKHYKKQFPGTDIYLLIKSGTGTEKILRENFVHDVLCLDYRRFAVDPFYGARFVNYLRRVGFAKVVNYDFSAAEIVGKIISIGIGAREVIGYEGQTIEFRKPFDYQQAQNLKIVRSKIFPHYTKLIPSIPVNPEITGYFPSELEYYQIIYESVSGRKEKDYSTELLFKNFREDMLKKFGLSKNGYVVLNVNSSVVCKCWPFDRFCKVARYLRDRGLQIVAVGSRRERERVENFIKTCPVKIRNLAGETDFEELIALIANCFLVFTNDTSSVHLAVALKKPSVCVVGGGQFGVAVDYGYKDINLWVYRKMPCFFDNWRCSNGLPEDTAAPCVTAVTAEVAIAKLETLVSYLKRVVGYPREKFSVHFGTGVADSNKKQ